MVDAITFRPLRRTDFPLLQRWMGEPHVHTWWHERLDLPGLEAKYGPRIDGAEPTHVFMIECNGQAIGWIQWYRWSDYPSHAQQLETPMDFAGIDLAIGEPARIGRGLGPQVIRRFLELIVFSDSSIAGVIVDVEQNNLRSLGAFQKAGFTAVKTVQLRAEEFQRCVLKTARISRG